MSNKKDRSPDSPGQSKPLTKESALILPDNVPEHTELVLLFRTDVPEEAEALHTFRAAFGAAAEIEAVTAELFALRIRPGVCLCGEETA